MHRRLDIPTSELEYRKLNQVDVKVYLSQISMPGYLRYRSRHYSDIGTGMAVTYRSLYISYIEAGISETTRDT